MVEKLIIFSLLATVFATTVFAYNPRPVAHYITKRATILEDDLRSFDALVRTRRDYSNAYNPPAYKPKTRGRVGPVYTFVKTDYDGNFKWGVRHRAGIKYAGGGYH